MPGSAGCGSATSVMPNRSVAALSELRIDYGPGYRIYFTWRGEAVVLLLCGGDKDSQAKDIVLAKRLAKEVTE
jgi:putative addiction module killer protein